jgi:hypothetical protein
MSRGVPLSPFVFLSDGSSVFPRLSRVEHKSCRDHEWTRALQEALVEVEEYLDQQRANAELLLAHRAVPKADDSPLSSASSAVPRMADIGALW